MSQGVKAKGLEQAELERARSWVVDGSRRGHSPEVWSHAVLHAQGWDMEGGYSAACPACRREGEGGGKSQNASQPSQAPL